MYKLKDLFDSLPEKKLLKGEIIRDIEKEIARLERLLTRPEGYEYPNLVEMRITALKRDLRNAQNPRMAKVKFFVGGVLRKIVDWTER